MALCHILAVIDSLVVVLYHHLLRAVLQVFGFNLEESSTQLYDCRLFITYTHEGLYAVFHCPVHAAVGSKL